MNILGVSSHYHDSAACLIRDGRLIAAAQEERFSRRKHDPRIPLKALKYCLDEADLTVADVDCIAYYEDPKKKLERQIWMKLGDIAAKGHRYLDRMDPGRPLRELRDLFGFERRILYFDHHLSHAASAYHFSGFDDAAVLTIDGVGEWCTASYAKGVDADLSIFQEEKFPHSLGLLYSALTAYLGFTVNDGEYKVMGLAPYGDDLFSYEMSRLARVTVTGGIELDLKYFNFSDDGVMYTSELCALFGRPPRVAETVIDAFHMNVARSLQVFLENCLLRMCEFLHTRVPSANLCLAGGVALNCVANSRLMRDGPFRDLFIQPAAGDAGGCLGAAALAHHKLTGERVSRARMTHAFYGPSTASEAIAALLAGSPVEAEDYRGRESALIEAVVERLASGQVIGWFQGRMEFGPRALGGRSILADPRRHDMRDLINSRVKMRESFRPFAPAVLDECAEDHFDMDRASPFMLETFQVRSGLDLPAVTHVDGSARVQTVSRDDAPRFARLLEGFSSRTGCPILLNTSFNMRGQPIVCTPVDAIVCFMQAKLDCLVLEDFLIDRSGIPDAWLDWYGHAGAVERAIPESVYTFL